MKYQNHCLSELLFLSNLPWIDVPAQPASKDVVVLWEYTSSHKIKVKLGKHRLFVAHQTSAKGLLSIVSDKLDLYYKGKGKHIHASKFAIEPAKRASQVGVGEKGNIRLGNIDGLLHDEQEVVLDVSRGLGAE